MKILKIAILVVLIAMSLAAGSAKLFQMPQEMAFFEQAGLDADLLIVFGIVQIAGGLLAGLKSTRKLGLLVMAATFLASSVTIMMAGNLPFALISVIPALLAIWLFWSERQTAGQTAL